MRKIYSWRDQRTSVTRFVFHKQPALKRGRAECVTQERSRKFFNGRTSSKNLSRSVITFDFCSSPVVLLWLWLQWLLPSSLPFSLRHHNWICQTPWRSMTPWQLLLKQRQLWRKPLSDNWSHNEEHHPLYGREVFLQVFYLLFERGIPTFFSNLYMEYQRMVFYNQGYQVSF